MPHFLQVIPASAQQRSSHAQVCSTCLLNFQNKAKLFFFISRLLFLQFAYVYVRTVTSAFMVLCLLCCFLFLECWSSLFFLCWPALRLCHKDGLLFTHSSVCIELGNYNVTQHGGGGGLENRKYLVCVSHFALKK